MDNIQEYNRLIYGDGWLAGKRYYRDLTPQDCDRLVGWLAYPKVRVRWSAAWRLGKGRDRRAVKPLIDALQDPHWLVRLHAAQALGRLADPRALEPLLEAADDECSFVRRRAVAALARFEDITLVQRLIRALSDPDKSVRAQASFGLARLRVSSAVDMLARAVSHGDIGASWRAVNAVERLGPGTIDALLALLEEPGEGVRRRARGAHRIAGWIGHQNLLVRAYARVALRIIVFWRRGLARSRRTAW